MEIAGACLAYGIEKLQMKRVVATMQTTHIRSARVAEKIGMTFESEFLITNNLPTLLWSRNAQLTP